MDNSNIDITKKEAIDFLEHHGVKGQRWGVRNDPGSKKYTGSTNKAPKSKSKNAHKNGVTKYSGKPHMLTDAELNARIKRLETEKKYKQLNKRDVSTGQKHVNEVLTNIGKNSVTKIGTAGALLVARHFIKRKFPETDFKIKM